MYINVSSANGYVYQIKLYTGKGSTVLEVIENLTYKHRGHYHLLYTDNFYISQEIIIKLKLGKIFMSVTCRIYKKNLSKTLIIQSTKLLKKKQLLAFNNGYINGVLFNDKRMMLFLFSFHTIDNADSVNFCTSINHECRCFLYIIIHQH
ncbi:hypothetical protein CDIK_3191 [Cucumispora dikerogammari]|nr:hypothetical protein CDIK_3191 [Cucumispora dikerogammari]